MRLLALNPYAVGSHKGFFDAWRDRSRHDWTLLELPGWNWKWRMRTAAIDFADRVHELIRKDVDGGERGKWARWGGWDAILCTDMLNAAELRGLLPAEIARLPMVVYFHENQAAYPVSAERGPDARDVHFVLTNMVSALAADEAWFNSAYNLRSLLDGLSGALAPVPEGAKAGLPERVRARSRVEPLGIDDALFEIDRGTRPPGPLRILWAARWEFDKRPDIFASAIERLAARGIDFTLDVLGGPEPDAAPAKSSAGAPFETLRTPLAPRIRRFGRARSREDFVKALAEADVAVSTAEHEFFGLAIGEATAAGALPVVPRALAYPEVLGDEGPAFHDNTPESLCAVLDSIGRRLGASGSVWGADAGAIRRRLARLRWSARGAALDDALDRVVRARQGDTSAPA